MEDFSTVPICTLQQIPSKAFSQRQHHYLALGHKNKIIFTIQQAKLDLTH
jgi:hypothetical protein